MQGWKTVEILADATDQGEVKAVFSVYDVIDAGKDRIKVGAWDAYAEQVNAGEVTPVVWQHEVRDPDLHIGVATKMDPRAKNSKGQLGIGATMQLDMDHPKANRAHKLIKSGRVRQWSHYWEGTAQRDPETGIRDLTDLVAHEISPVLVGMNRDTETMAVKADMVSFTDSHGVTWVPAGSQAEGSMRTFTTAQRVALAKKGWAIPVRNEDGEIVDGRYPIEVVGDLQNAVQAIGRVAEGDRGMVIRHIKRQASRLGRTDLIPDDWKADADPQVKLLVTDVDITLAELGIA